MTTTVTVTVTATVSYVGQGYSYYDQESYVSIDRATIRITPYKHWNNDWAHWAFHMPGGTTPTFYIAKADHYGLVEGERLCCWAYAPDTDTWHDFDNVTIGETDLEFSNDDPFPAGLIYVAALPMYPFSRIQRKMSLWLQHPYVSDTTSSTDGIIDYATERAVNDGSGRTVPALPFYGFKISSGAGDKNTVILSAYNHPSETPGPFSLEGAVDWLLAGSEQANGLLTYTNFFVYPCLNPQGVWSGWFRSCPQAPTYDHNRKFFDGTSGVVESVDTMKAAIAADCAAVDALFDFHSFMWDYVRFGNCIDHTDADHVAYKNEVNTYDAAWYLSTSAVSDGMKDWISDEYGSTINIAPENGGALTLDVQGFIAHGENLMKGLADFVADGGLTYGP